MNYWKNWQSLPDMFLEKNFLIIVRTIVVVGLTLVAFVAYAGVQFDPIFGLKYDSDKVRFEKAPAYIGTVCRNIPDRDLRIYGKFNSGGRTYFVLSGIYKNSTNEPDALGLVVSIKGDSCSYGNIETVLSGKSGRSKVQREHIKLNNEELSTLTDDIIRRYTAAFGSKAAFIKTIKKDNFDIGTLPPILRDAVLKVLNQ